jgi:hypothetical protein
VHAKRVDSIRFRSSVFHSAYGRIGATSRELPEVRVRAPSPIVRRKPRPAPAAAAEPTQAAPARTTAETPLPGTLPIVTDQFATVTTIPNEELRRSTGGTLGDLLFSKPGVTGSGFAPGASSRPVIRGLDANRVGIVENGGSGGGVSDLGEDHFVPVDPLTSDQIEVIRGPPNPALWFAIDWRCRQRHQQPHSRIDSGAWHHYGIPRRCDERRQWS